MRILILVPFLPYPDVGHAGGIVLWHMIQGLAARHELHLISFVNNEREQNRQETLLNYCASVKTIFHVNASVASDFRLHASQRARSLLFSKLPYSAWRLRSRTMFKTVTETLKKMAFDIVQVEFTPMAQYIDVLENHPCTIFRGHDLAFILYERRVQATKIFWHKLYHYIQWQRMRRYELAIYRRFHQVIVPSDQIKTELLAQLPNLDVSVVPFGITLPSVPASVESPVNQQILFVGAIGRSLNTEAVIYFYQQIWPHIRAEEPETEFWIVGSDPPPHVRQLAQTDSNIKVTGFVDNLVPFYTRASVVVVPLLIGGGVVTKILDAMAMSRAVVTTSIANEGIGAVPGQDLIVADEPDEFARRVVELLRDPNQRQHIGQNGRRFVEEKFSWRSIIERLECIYDKMLTKNSRTARDKK